jgi:RimJ/RimL family protein N-acetyltransferase
MSMATSPWGEIESVRWAAGSIPGVETCVIEPEPANKRAIRSYEKAGFKFAKTYHSYANEMDCYLMRQERIPD